MSCKLLIAVVFTSLVTMSLGAVAEDIDDAVEFMHRGDFAKAYCIMRPLAEAGDAESQYNIGWMYLNGYGLRVDDRQALEWWLKASDQGHTDASFSIGMLYSLGEGKVAKDLNRAIDYYLIAAQDGNDDAIKLLQYMMMRNDPEIRSRLHDIVNQLDTLFGERLQVKAKKLNAREGPSVREKIVTRLLNGQAVLELFRKGKWSQVVVLGEEQIDQTVWVYNPMLERAPLPDAGTDIEAGHEQVLEPAVNPGLGSRLTPAPDSSTDIEQAPVNNQQHAPKPHKL